MVFCDFDLGYICVIVDDSYFFFKVGDNVILQIKYIFEFDIFCNQIFYVCVDIVYVDDIFYDMSFCCFNVIQLDIGDLDSFKDFDKFGFDDNDDDVDKDEFGSNDFSFFFGGGGKFGFFGGVIVGIVVGFFVGVVGLVVVVIFFNRKR